MTQIPQMNPMNWINLYFYYLMILFNILMMMFFYSKKYMKLNIKNIINLKNKKSFSLLW